jgi:putative copper resistance protein D
MSATLTDALAFARFAEFVAAMTLLGTALFRFYAMPYRQTATAHLFETTAATLRRILIVAGVGAALAAVGWAATTFTEVAGGFNELTDPATITAFFFGTGFGVVWLLRLVVAVLLFVAVLVPQTRQYQRNSATAIIAALAAALLASQGWIGHPAAIAGTERDLVIAAYIVHVVSAGIWIGGLVPLAVLLVSARRVGGKAVAAADLALHRFSAVGMVAAAGVLAGGIVNAYSRLDSLAAFANSDWGRVLACKIVLFLGLIGFASINRFILLPRLAARPEPTMASLARSIAFEQVAGVLALFAAAWLGILMPPM